MVHHQIDLHDATVAHTIQDNTISASYIINYIIDLVGATSYICKSIARFSIEVLRWNIYLVCSCHFLEVWNISNWSNRKSSVNKTVMNKHVCHTEHGNT